VLRHVFSHSFSLIIYCNYIPIGHCTLHTSLFALHTSHHQIPLNKEQSFFDMVDFTVFKGSKEGKIVQATTTREIGSDEVLIKVTHSGLCGTDEHYRHADMALGHEGAGVIEV
jgi:hypothetical protein